MTRAEQPRLNGVVNTKIGIAFNVDDAQSAAAEWGFNCGPAAICAITGMTPSEVRPFLGDFESKRYTNPGLMFEILRGMGVSFKTAPLDWFPKWGLARVQWGGPWMQPAVPVRARYRHTHWVASRWLGDKTMIYDVNCTCVGWVPSEEWTDQVVPWLLKQVEPQNDGTWSLTHCLEVAR